MSFFNKLSKFSQRFPWLAAPIALVTILVLGVPIMVGLMVFVPLACPFGLPSLK
jgi:hypothetical protein